MKSPTRSASSRSDENIKRSVILGEDILNEDSFWEICGESVKCASCPSSRERLTFSDASDSCDLYLFLGYEDVPLYQSFKDLLHQHRCQLSEATLSYERYCSRMSRILRKPASPPAQLFEEPHCGVEVLRVHDHVGRLQMTNEATRECNDGGDMCSFGDVGPPPYLRL